MPRSSPAATCSTNPRTTSRAKPPRPSPCAQERGERIFFIRHALRAGFTIEEIFNLTKIDRWFWVRIKEIVHFEEEPAGGGGLSKTTPAR